MKDVYRAIQHNKCAYCERLLAHVEDRPRLGAKDHDIEHYRPKAKVIAWRKRRAYPNHHVAFDKRMGRRKGYYWLAFELWNWCVSCTLCNSQLKGNRFPIAKTGREGDHSADIAALNAQEKPLLVYPLGDVDTDPEELLAFHGVTVQPKAASGYARERGETIIAFFLLNNPTLAKWRAVWIRLIWDAVQDEHAGKTGAMDVVDEYLTGTKPPHAAALRAFIRLARSDFPAAKALYEQQVMPLTRGFLR